jgi:hypothetical protein
MRVTYLLIFCLLSVSCARSDNKIYYAEGFIVGFDPCTGAYPEDYNKGFIIITQSKDTLLTYNLPNGIYSFPISYFTSYKNTFLFPDSVKENFKIDFSYSIVPDNEKKASFCFGDIYQGDFISFVRDRQITILKANNK